MAKTRQQIAVEARKKGGSRNESSLAVLGDSTNQGGQVQPQAQNQPNREKEPARRRSARLVQKEEAENKRPPAKPNSKLPPKIPNRGRGAKRNQPRKVAVISESDAQPQRKRQRASSQSKVPGSDVVARQSTSAPRRERQSSESFKHTLAMSPFVPTRFTLGISVHDKPHSKVPQETPELVTDIYHRLYEAQNRFRIMPYTEKHPYMTEQIRYRLIDWMCYVSRHLGTLPETVHLAVYILDRYFSLCVVHQHHQLVAAAALWIASKYEEVEIISAMDFQSAAEWSFHLQDLYAQETAILKTIEYRISAPTGFHFLQRFVWIAKANKMMTYAASYYLEATLPVEEALFFTPAELANAAVSLAISHPDIQPPGYDREDMIQVLENYTALDRLRVFAAAELIVTLFHEPGFGRQGGCIGDGIWKKYSKQRFARVAFIEPPSLEDLPFE